MTRGASVAAIIAGAVACGAFGSTADTSPAATGGYVIGVTVTCSDIDGGVCRVPDYCCVRDGTNNLCTTQGCAEEDNAAVHCVDDTPCAPGYVCCARVDNFHIASVICDTNCVAPSSRTIGAGAFHVCGSRGSAGCDGGLCGSLEGDAIGGHVIPSAHLQVCQ